MPQDTIGADVEFVTVCAVDDLWDDEMEAFDVGGVEVLLIKRSGRFFAYHGSCPHQEVPLVEGALERGVLTCRAHMWQFDVESGRGVNPASACLTRYPVRIDGDHVMVAVAPQEEA